MSGLGGLGLIFVGIGFIALGGWMFRAVPLGPVGVIAVMACFSAPGLAAILDGFKMILPRRAPHSRETS